MSEAEKEKVLTRFVGDVARHQVDIIREDGIYRHLRFKRPGSSAYYFDLVTWPGYLAVTGDIGTWTFSRITDMFEFFTDEHFGRRESFLINPGYWAEKFEAGAGRARHESPCYEFDSSSFDKTLKEWLAAYLEECEDEHDADMAKEAIDELVGAGFTTEKEAYHALNDAYFPSDVSSYDIAEGMGSTLTYSYHYLWICYAIVWGIERYNASKIVSGAMDKFIAVRAAA